MKHSDFLCCVTKYKDTNLKAIHNSNSKIQNYIAVVLLSTKIQIWKQFTTDDVGFIERHGCVTKYKDTNLKAIHNEEHTHMLFRDVVLLSTKIQIWKQFTTVPMELTAAHWLCY